MRLKSLENRVQAMERLLRPGQRQWYLILEEGEYAELPACVTRHFHEEDDIVVKQYPKGLLGERLGDWSYGWLSDSRGVKIVYPDGRLTPVKRSAVQGRRRSL